MDKNLVIVESPAKAKTIERFLGKDFIVKSSFGHIRDLSKKKLGVDVENNYSPEYIINEDKKNVVDDLKKAVKKADIVWLASDEDREGEAISWHLMQVLNLDPAKTRRIVFHEITKDAILNAIQNPRQVDLNLVNSQQARRILDRLVGFELSPILWKKVKPALSAGRVQSVAVRLIVEREREVFAFQPVSFYRVTGQFGGDVELKADLSERINDKDGTTKFLEHCKSAKFTIADITKKPAKKSPQPPFTTSTLQQEAGRKFNFSVSQTMTVAQRLYEAGFITYMRTDSVNLSETAIAAAEQVITAQFGKKYHQARRYKTKAKGAQEAHEAIRPTYFDKEKISGNASEQKLYELIWKRAIASQMSDASIEKTTISIDVSGSKYQFVASGEVIIFDGFIKVYMESTDEEQESTSKAILPSVSVGQKLQPIEIVAVERYTQRPARYSEASLVKKMEELGIGRPSTYAPTISTIINRGYVVKEDRPGTERAYTTISLKGGRITSAQKVEITGAEKSKLFPSDIGIVVNDFLIEYFKDIMCFDFTANVEKDFDEIAEGNIEWTKMIDEFYRPFHALVEKTTRESDYSKGERVLGVDPASGKNVVVRIGRFGPLVQIGENDKENNIKAKFASLLKGQLIETITLEQALDLFKLPRTLGSYEEHEVVVGVGRFGPYVRHNSKFYSLKKTDDPITIDLARAIDVIEEGRRKEREKVIRIFEPEAIHVLNGRWGPYVMHNGVNYKIPKGTDAAKLTVEDCRAIMSSTPSAKQRKKPTATKKTAKPSKKTK